MTETSSHSFEDLFNRLRRIEEKIDSLTSKRVQPHSPSKEDESLLNRQNAADILGISLSTLNNLTNQGKLVKYKIGGRTLYKRTEIVSALEQIKLSH